MIMQVVITEGQLKASDACAVYIGSPEWSEEQRSLVYADWSATVERLFSTRAGTGYLQFLVSRGLVPMTAEEFKVALAARRSA
jgi:hypothetical protein